jgi:hypothetical protein
MRYARLYTAVLVAAVLSACQSMPQVPYDRATAGNIKTINIVTPAAPERPRVVLMSTVGQSFGLIGALIDAGMQEAREDDFEDITKAQNFAANDAFKKHLDQALRADGYAAVYSEAKRAQHGFLKSYSAPSSGAADAHLDIVMNYGYYATGLATPYRPFVYMETKMVRASDNALLMQKTVFYNPLNAPPKDAVTIPPDPAYEFPDFESIEKDPAKAVKGLDHAIQQVAGAMGVLLR